MSEIYIHHNLGLGDHMMCHGFVRELSKQYSPVYLFCKPVYFDSVSYMYRDDDNIICLAKDDNDAVNYAIEKKLKTYVRIDQMNMHPSLEECLYLQANVPFNKKFKNFKVQRNLEREADFFNKFNVTPNNYIFIHDDPARNQIVNREFIENKDLPIITTNFNHTTNIFDYSLLIECAREIHCIESCFMFVADLLYPDNKQKLAIHRYCKLMPKAEEPHNQKNWTIYAQPTSI